MIGKRLKVETTEFQKRFYPRHGFLLIEKDMVSDEWGNLSIPDTTKERMNRYASSGTVIKIPLFKSENEHTDYLMSMIRVGDHVVFSCEIPLLAGAPPYYDIYKQGKKERPEKDATMLIHVSDITGWILETDEKRKEFEDRFDFEASSGIVRVPLSVANESLQEQIRLMGKAISDGSAGDEVSIGT